MYRLLSSSLESDDLSIGFDRGRDRRKRELPNNRNIKGKYHLRIYLRDIFGFLEHQETATCGLGYKLTLTRNTDNAVLNKANATNNAKTKINSLEWYVPHYIPSLNDYNKLMNHIKNKTPTNLHYPERSVFMKEINTQNFWSFELGTQEGVNVPIWTYVVFQQSDRQHEQILNNDTFGIWQTSGNIRSSRYRKRKVLDTAILLNYNGDDYSQG